MTFSLPNGLYLISFHPAVHDVDPEALSPGNRYQDKRCGGSANGRKPPLVRELNPDSSSYLSTSLAGTSMVAIAAIKANAAST
jgi:hypothetical protein